MQKIDGLEGLRGYMAIWVWVTHVTTMAALPFYKTSGWGRILANGDLAVGVFIILSGFVISASVLKTRDTRYTDYITRRALRLFPAYIVCLIASVFILDLSINLLQAMPWEGNRTEGRLAYLEASKENFWTHLALHVALLHGMVPDSILPFTSYAFMGQAWSLTLEWQFYLVAPILLMAVERIKSNFAPMLLILLGLTLLSTRFTQASFLPSNLYFFFIGYLTYRLWYSDRRSAVADSKAPLFLVVVLSIAAVGITKGIRGGAAIIWFLAIFSLQGHLGVFGRVIRLVVDNRFARWLGTVSYGFYCVHMVSIFLCAHFILTVLKIESHFLYASLLFVSSLTLGLLLSWMLYIFVEHPFIAWGKIITQRARVQTAAGQTS